MLMVSSSGGGASGDADVVATGTVSRGVRVGRAPAVTPTWL